MPWSVHGHLPEKAALETTGAWRATTRGYSSFPMDINTQLFYAVPKGFGWEKGKSNLFN